MFSREYLLLNREDFKLLLILHITQQYIIIVLLSCDFLLFLNLSLNASNFIRIRGAI